MLDIVPVYECELPFLPSGGDVDNDNEQFLMDSFAEYGTKLEISFDAKHKLVPCRSILVQVLCEEWERKKNGSLCEKNLSQKSYMFSAFKFFGMVFHELFKTAICERLPLLWKNGMQ